jgi:uncharacterized protein YyaL (SSP411 family)
MIVISGCQSSDTQAQQHAYTNHLIDESSPYLLQHAHNPVDWHPWGEVALEKAREENKMLLISIGYAACHWCHVMERESFEDTTVARIMNEHFVNIKVDREERPDVDDVYLTACQMASGEACGWPLNAFALPDGRPVWAGTYSPKKQWIEILRYFIDLQQKEPEKLDAYADRLLAGIAESDQMNIQPLEQGDFTTDQLEEIVGDYYESVDFKRGGVKGAPKFPMPRVQEFLLAYHHATGDPKALEAVTTTLREMAGGGIYDYLGGGFARYSTDPDWHVPHFEKMLYDNAQLVSLYAHAYQLTGDPGYRTIIEETLGYIRREMTGPEGGFYSSIDADSEGEEGKFYVWTQAEIEAILDGPARDLFIRFYHIEEEGNWEEGKNILDPGHPLSEVAEELDLPLEEAQQLLRTAEQSLFEKRRQRIRPALDDKRLTAWNALMLKGYIDAYHALGDTAYLNAALRNAHFIRGKMMQENGRLDRNYKDGQSVINGFLDDYALTARSFISLYQATFDEAWLELARKLAAYAVAHFYDEESQLFHYTSKLDPPLVARKKEIVDNVIPGSNSTIARVLHDLGKYYYNQDYLDRARHMLRQVGGTVQESAELAYYANWGLLWLDQIRPPYEVAIVGPDYAEKRRELMRHYLPHALLLGGPDEGNLELLEDKLQEGRTMIYVCQNKVCRLPVTEVEKALELME